MIFLLLFVLGTLVGSFLNVCIWRMPRGESVVAPPSHCPTCNTRLTLLDLFPLVSQLYLRGKCRYCGAKFSWRYAGIEFTTGILFALLAIQAGNVSDFTFFRVVDGRLRQIAARPDFYGHSHCRVLGGLRHAIDSTRIGIIDGIGGVGLRRLSRLAERRCEDDFDGR